jgi:hypothetical protein
MYDDEEILERYKKTWLTKEVHRLAKEEVKRLRTEEGRKVSVQKLINNAFLEKYADISKRRKEDSRTSWV